MFSSACGAPFIPFAISGATFTPHSSSCFSCVALSPLEPEFIPATRICLPSLVVAKTISTVAPFPCPSPLILFASAVRPPSRAMLVATLAFGRRSVWGTTDGLAGGGAAGSDGFGSAFFGSGLGSVPLFSPPDDLSLMLCDIICTVDPLCAATDTAAGASLKAPTDASSFCPPDARAKAARGPPDIGPVGLTNPRVISAAFAAASALCCSTPAACRPDESAISVTLRSSLPDIIWRAPAS